MGFVALTEFASLHQTHLLTVWRRERRGRGVGGVFERSHIQPGADRQQCSGRASHGWFCVCALMFHILTHACKHAHRPHCECIYLDSVEAPIGS